MDRILRFQIEIIIEGVSKELERYQARYIIAGKLILISVASNINCKFFNESLKKGKITSNRERQ